MYLDVFYNKKNNHLTIECEFLWTFKKRGEGVMKNHGQYINIRFNWFGLGPLLVWHTMHCQQACQPRQGRRPYSRLFLMHFHASWLLMSVTNALKRIFRKGIMNKLKIRIETCHTHTYTQRHTHTHIYIIETFLCVSLTCQYIYLYIQKTLD